MFEFEENGSIDIAIIQHETKICMLKSMLSSMSVIQSTVYPAFTLLCEERYNLSVNRIERLKFAKSQSIVSPQEYDAWKDNMDVMIDKRKKTIQEVNHRYRHYEYCYNIMFGGCLGGYPEVIDADTDYDKMLDDMKCVIESYHMYHNRKLAENGKVQHYGYDPLYKKPIHLCDCGEKSEQGDPCTILFNYSKITSSVCNKKLWLDVSMCDMLDGYDSDSDRHVGVFVIQPIESTD